ncbi:MAG: endonuclease/exonuclease/phosphatase family protein [Bacteroidaceae bacterium]|nr:endonuclease/exonuclease/phosphatase family protein [Prevotellaceae bacterium]MDY5632392.1 endonuclease/exonuclease/phosphatase family protein [Bacteroidaceae bacterium]
MIILLSFVLTLRPAYAQRHAMRVMTWNVENMFDCQDDSLTNDAEFLPDAKRKWTWGRYWKKMESLGRVILAVGKEEPVDLVGLCEVENDSVMHDLTKKGLLGAVSYRYVMTNGSDQRGVDVALLYQPARFRLLDWHAVRIPSKENAFPPTRDILWTKGITFQRDTLHVIVCHFPSRTNGMKSERHRRLASQTLAALVDSIGTDKNILVMGDFNADPQDPIFRTLGVLQDNVPQKRYPDIGSYNFRGIWSWIDHILISSSLIHRSAMAAPYYAPWMCTTNANGFWRPRRTYLGTYYNGGVSDHLPIWMDINP